MATSGETRGATTRGRSTTTIISSPSTLLCSDPSFMSDIFQLSPQPPHRQHRQPRPFPIIANQDNRSPYHRRSSHPVTTPPGRRTETSNLAKKKNSTYSRPKSIVTTAPPLSQTAAIATKTATTTAATTTTTKKKTPFYGNTEVILKEDDNNPPVKLFRRPKNRHPVESIISMRNDPRPSRNTHTNNTNTMSSTESTSVPSLTNRLKVLNCFGSEHKHHPTTDPSPSLPALAPPTVSSAKVRSSSSPGFVDTLHQYVGAGRIDSYDKLNKTTVMVTTAAPRGTVASASVSPSSLAQSRSVNYQQTSSPRFSPPARAVSLPARATAAAATAATAVAAAAPVHETDTILSELQAEEAFLQKITTKLAEEEHKDPQVAAPTTTTTTASGTTFLNRRLRHDSKLMLRHRSSLQQPKHRRPISPPRSSFSSYRPQQLNTSLRKSASKVGPTSSVPAPVPSRVPSMLAAATAPLQKFSDKFVEAAKKSTTIPAKVREEDVTKKKTKKKQLMAVTAAEVRNWRQRMLSSSSRNQQSTPTIDNTTSSHIRYKEEEDRREEVGGADRGQDGSGKNNHPHEEETMDETITSYSTTYSTIGDVSSITGGTFQVQEEDDLSAVMGVMMSAQTLARKKQQQQQQQQHTDKQQLQHQLQVQRTLQEQLQSCTNVLDTTMMAPATTTMTAKCHFCGQNHWIYNCPFMNPTNYDFTYNHDRVLDARGGGREGGGGRDDSTTTDSSGTGTWAGTLSFSEGSLRSTTGNQTAKQNKAGTGTGSTKIVLGAKANPNPERHPPRNTRMVNGGIEGC